MINVKETQNVFYLWQSLEEVQNVFYFKENAKCVLFLRVKETHIYFC